MNDLAAVTEKAVVKDRLDLLPLAFQRKMLRHSRIRQWSVVLGACFLVALAIWIRQHYEYQLRQQGLDARRLRAAPLQTVQTQNVELRKRLAQMRQEQQLRAELESEQIAFHLLATVSRSAATCSDGVQVQQFSFSRTRSIVNSQPSNTQPSSADGQPGQPDQKTEIETLVMTVKGIGADNLMVSRFVVALRDSQVFDKVDLKSSMGGAGQARGIRAFVVECTL
jgi:hypothetical protein